MTTLQEGCVRHLKLSCGHTIEEIVEIPITVGDAVTYQNELYRVDDLYTEPGFEDDMASIRNIDSEFDVEVVLLTRVGIDTLSGMDVSPIVGGFSIGSWVEHKKFGTKGQVTEIKPDGRYKCESYNLDRDSFTYYIWQASVLLPSHPSEIHKVARDRVTPIRPKPRSGSPGQSSYDWGGKKYDSYGTGGGDNSYNQWNSSYDHSNYNKPASKPKPKPQDSISTASLIKKEVSKLEESDRAEKAAAAKPKSTESKPSVISKLKPTTSSPRESPQKTFDTDSDQDAEPIPTRKGEW